MVATATSTAPSLASLSTLTEPASCPSLRGRLMAEATASCPPAHWQPQPGGGELPASKKLPTPSTPSPGPAAPPLTKAIIKTFPPRLQSVPWGGKRGHWPCPALCARGSAVGSGLPACLLGGQFQCALLWQAQHCKRGPLTSRPVTLTPGNHPSGPRCGSVLAAEKNRIFTEGCLTLVHALQP